MRRPLVIRNEDARRFQLGPDVWIVRAGAEETAGRFDVLEAKVSRLQGPPLHVHAEQEDTFLVLSGTLKLQVGEELIDLHPGDLASAPPGVPHTYTNVEDEPAHVVNIMTPGGLDRAFADFVKLPPGPPPPELLRELANNHGIEVVGPPIAVRLGLVGEDS